MLCSALMCGALEVVKGNSIPLVWSALKRFKQMQRDKVFQPSNQRDSRTEFAGQISMMSSNGLPTNPGVQGK